MTDVDVLVVGAGPAGATVALNLAPRWTVMLVERRPAPAIQIGESLIPAARRLLADMGLLADVEAGPHLPWFGNRSVWSSPDTVDADFIRSPDGPGFHLDRAAFETMLIGRALDRGTLLLRPARLGAVERVPDGWHVAITTPAGSTTVSARVLVDASGRAAPLARRLGARRTMRSRLVARWLYGTSAGGGPGTGLTFVEAAPGGWWYTAPVPGGRRVVAFHTDTDLAGPGLDAAGLVAASAAAPGVASILAAGDFEPVGPARSAAAGTSYLDRPAGDRWYAAGDAALAVDPLASRGVFNALFTGVAVAEASDRDLAGDAGAPAGYASLLTGIRRRYLEDLTAVYRAEQRWPAAEFWRRRSAASGLGRMGAVGRLA